MTIVKGSGVPMKTRTEGLLKWFSRSLSNTAIGAALLLLFGNVTLTSTNCILCS
ncbi:MAG: hypothetical protein ACJAX3_000830 [Patiriisocius sp.]|jgi:hypothetical protein